MKLNELVLNQRITIQLMVGDKKIEFFSNVMDKDEESVYMTPYILNGNALELNVVNDPHVTCNIFADEPSTNQRISWRAVELTTLHRNDQMMYQLKTHRFNRIAVPDDRRAYDRVPVQLNGVVYGSQLGDGENIIIHDISESGISFLAPTTFALHSQQVTIDFADTIGKREFSLRVDCTIARMCAQEDSILVGCKIINENKDYLLYEFMKHIASKTANHLHKANDASDEHTEEGAETAQTQESAIA